MKKLIAIPVEIILEIDERVLGGKIKKITVKSKPITLKQASKLFKQK